MYIIAYKYYYIIDCFIMTTHYQELKNFVNSIYTNSNITRKYIGKILLHEIKHNKIKRCRCRRFNPITLNINEQCSNPVSTISNLCYHCDKYNDYIGFVNVKPSDDLIQIYEKYGQKHKIVFRKNSFRIGLYKKYITHNYLKYKIIDYEKYCSIKVFKIPDITTTNNGILVDKYSNIIGTYYPWIDTNNNIPTTCKNENNCVLDPQNYIPLFEYNLTETSIYHQLTNKIYRRYTYNGSVQRLLLTQNIKDC